MAGEGAGGGYATLLPLHILTVCYFSGVFSVRFHKVQREIIFGDQLSNICCTVSYASIFLFFRKKVVNIASLELGPDSGAGFK